MRRGKTREGAHQLNFRRSEFLTPARARLGHVTTAHRVSSTYLRIYVSTYLSTSVVTIFWDNKQWSLIYGTGGIFSLSPPC